MYKKIYCMMEKEPYLSQKSQKEHLVNIIKNGACWKNHASIYYTYRNFPVIQKKSKWMTKNI